VASDLIAATTPGLLVIRGFINIYPTYHWKIQTDNEFPIVRSAFPLTKVHEATAKRHLGKAVGERG
jgi:hypothetical protein